MFRLFSVVFICFEILFQTSLQGEEKAEGTISSLGTLEVGHFQLLVDGNNRFAFDFFHGMRHQPSNFCFSPYNIISGLILPATGARDETAQQFHRLLRYPLSLLPLFRDLNEFLQQPTSEERNRSQVWLSQNLWLQKELPILQSFKQMMVRNFNIQLQFPDFEKNRSQSVQMINQKVLEQTEKKIQHLLNVQDITSNTQMVLTMAMVMKGQWAQPFNPKETIRQTFYYTPQRPFNTSMMRGTFKCLIWNGEEGDLLVLPFVQSGNHIQLEMTIFLPKEDKSLEELEKKLNWKNWEQWRKQAQMQSVTVYLPRFRIEKRLELSHYLEALGLSKLFNANANFTGIMQEQPLFINRAIHKTMIKIDEYGMDAPPSSMGIGSKSLESEENGQAPFPFIANHPFIFVISDQKTHSILLMGRLSIP